MANPVKIPISEDATAQLRGVSGTVTDGITLNGVYSSGWLCHVFQVLISGAYELWVDPAGGSSYSKDSTWSGASGKWVPGEDFKESVEPIP